MLFVSTLLLLLLLLLYIAYTSITITITIIITLYLYVFAPQDPSTSQRGAFSWSDHRWNGNSRPQPQTFTKLVCLI